MDPIVVGIIVFACTFAGTLLGMWLRTALPEHYFDDESRDTVKLGIGLIATMTALVLGLVTASAKSSFDGVDTGVKQFATQLFTLDRALARYGSDTGEIRTNLQRALGARIDMLWPQDASELRLAPMRVPGVEEIAHSIRELKPKDAAQRALQARAVDVAESLLQGRFLVITATGTSVPIPFLTVLVFWLTITFASFGLFAPRNAMVVTVLFVCALSVSSAVLLVLELDGPFDGLLRVSADPLRAVHALMNQ